MIFTVSAAPYLKVHGLSTSSVKQFEQELTDIGIGGISVNCYDPAHNPEKTNSAQIILEHALPAGLRVCAHAPATDISATNPAIRKQAVDSIRRAILHLGSSLPGAVITVHPENYSAKRQLGDDEARMDCCRKSLETLSDTVSDLGARIALENMRWRSDASNRTGMYVDQLSDIISGLDASTVGICFDTGHANISEKDNLVDVFRRNASRIIHMHFQDNVGGEDLHLPPGQGNIDFSQLFHTIKQCGYRGMVELEVPVQEGDNPLSFYKRNYLYFVRVVG